MSAARTGWVEVADRVWLRRYDPYDVNVVVIGGGGALAVVDTRASSAQGEEARAHVRELSADPVALVVNTHVHFDHTFGNSAFAGVDVWAHVRCRRGLTEEVEVHRQAALDWAGPDGAAEVHATEVVAPTRTLEASAEVTVGGRALSLRHLGRGHTDGDVVVVVADADVVVAGDLVEESAPPWFGDGYPLEWPDTVAALLDLGAATALPGHGAAMSRDDVERQLADLRTLAELARWHLDGELSEDAAAARSPFPADTTREALERARTVAGR